VLACTHPDVITVTHEKPTTVSVDDVRDQINSAALIRPFEAPYKIFIVPDAQMMNPQAQNALLKTIEEPPEYAIILLLTTNEQMLLETIRSRCVLLRMEEGNAVDEESEEYGRNVEILRHITEAGSVTMLSDIALICTDGAAGARRFAEFARMWYHDMLMLNVCRDVESLALKKQKNDIAALAAGREPADIYKVLKAIDEAESRLRSNVNPELSLEMLLLSMQS